MSCTTFMITLILFVVCVYVIEEVNFKRIMKKLIDRISKDVKIIRRDRDE